MPVIPNPFLKDISTYQPGRPIEEVARELGLRPELISKLASNENPLGPSPAALEAMRNVLPLLHYYPDGNAFYLKEKLAQKLGLSPKNLIFGNGSNEILEFVGHAFLTPGCDVVASEYCFAVYPLIAQMFGARLITAPAKQLGHDVDKILEAITPATRVVFAANPNNPTGTLMERADVARLVNEVPDNVLLVMDEAYIEFLDDPVDLVPLIRNGVKQNLLLMRTFSKIYGLAGLRLGYAMAAPEIISVFEKVRQPFNINALVQAAALAALGDEEHVHRTRELNFNGRRFFEDTFRKRGLAYVPSSANFVLVKVGDGVKVFQELQKQGIIVRPMASYQLPEWIRISIGTREQNEKCMNALGKMLKN